MKTPTPAITLLLILSVAYLRPAQAEPEPPEDGPEPTMVACGPGPVIIGALVIMVGIYVGVKLERFCKKHLPPSPPPPPPVPPPPCTNCPATNAPPNKIRTLDDSGADMWDIASYGWSDTQGYLYTVLVHATVESSTNLTNWEPLMSLKAWCSISNVLTVIYDPSGTAVVTNYTSTGTNGIPLNTLPSMGGQPAQAQFFRLKTPL